MHNIPWGAVGAIGGTFVAIIGIIIGTQRYNADKRSRIYGRLDECKEDFNVKVEKDYARKDICALTHQTVEKRLEAIEKQTALLPNIAAQVKMLVNGTKT